MVNLAQQLIAKSQAKDASQFQNGQNKAEKELRKVALPPPASATCAQFEFVLSAAGKLEKDGERASAEIGSLYPRRQEIL